MKISGPSAVAVVLVGHSAGAFKSNPVLTHARWTRKWNSASSTPNLMRLPCLSTRRRRSLQMSTSHNEREVSSQTPRFNDEVVTSRRAALRRCSSIFSAAVCSFLLNRREANASEFSESPVRGEAAEQRLPIQNTAPQFYDESVITPPRPQVMREEAPDSNPIPPEPSVAVVAQEATETNPTISESSGSTTLASNPPSAAAEVTFENSQLVQIPVANSASGSAQAPSVDVPSSTPEKSKNGNGSGGGKVFVLEASAVTAVLGATVRAVSGRVEPNTDELTAKCKVVMIENEPYGLDTGRRFYKGVDVTINDPVPASDVREFCEAGKVNDDCTETIAGFLGEVSTNNEGGGGEAPSMVQQETATAVLSYLDSLNHGGQANSETSMAFSSYLNVLSNGEIDAPASPKLVANYLDSISKDGIQRLSTVENRINDLESSVNRLPYEISGRLMEWQEKQDERLAEELTKIQSFLVNANVNGSRSDFTSSSPVNEVNGSPVNGASGSAVNGEGYQSRLPFS